MRKIITNSALVLVLGLTGGIGCKRNEEGGAPAPAALAQSGQSSSGSSPASGSQGTGSGTSSGNTSSATGTGGPNTGSGMGNGNGQTSGTTGGTATGQPSGGMGAGQQGAAMELRTPEQVLVAVHMINQMEIESGQLAQRKGSSEQVKRLGAALVKDHQAADKKVMALAKKQKIELPTGGAGATSTGAAGGMAAMASPQMRELRQEMERLRTLEGRAFDEQFATFQVRAHRQSIDMLTSARTNVQDEQVRTLISELLPQLEKHEQQAHGAQTSGADSQGHGQGQGTQQGR